MNGSYETAKKNISCSSSRTFVLYAILRNNGLLSDAYLLIVENTRINIEKSITKLKDFCGGGRMVGLTYNISQRIIIIK